MHFTGFGESMMEIGRNLEGKKSLLISNQVTYDRPRLY